MGTKLRPVTDPHILYEASVQGVEADVDFFRDVYRKYRGQRATLLREDFCGTGALACAWIKSNQANRAWGVDIDEPTLDWARKHRVPLLSESQADRLTLQLGDVRTAKTPPVDIVAALNFSYWIFRTRAEMRSYFEHVHASLDNNGLFFADAFGGTEAMSAVKEERKVKNETAPDGSKIPTFTYVWHQENFNPVDHEMSCHIHFKLGDGTKIKRAFSYSWRFWMLPEIQELMREAGFKETAVYVDGWDEKAEDADGIYRKKRSFENQEGWVAYLVAVK